MVFAPAVEGDVGIAPRHAPLLTLLRAGEVRVRDEQGNDAHYFVSGGILEIQPFKVTVLADTALRARTSTRRRRWKRSVVPNVLAQHQSDIDYARARRSWPKPLPSCKCWSGCARSAVEAPVCRQMTESPRKRAFCFSGAHRVRPTARGQGTTGGVHPSEKPRFRFQPRSVTVTP